MFDKPLISLAFDDGWRNAHTRAAPIMEACGLRGTFYVITRMPSYMLSEGEGRMTVEDWVDLRGRGHEIGAHSRTHAELPKCSETDLESEVGGSRADLATAGIEATTFAYPFGQKNASVAAAVARAGFRAGRLYNEKLNRAGSERWSLGSFAATGGLSIADAETLLQRAVRSKSWLILTFHQIEHDPPPCGMTEDQFRRVCELVAQQPADVVTVEEGARRLNG